MTTLEFDPADRDMPSVAVVRAVAAEMGRAASNLDCTLQETIDTKALNNLFSVTPAGVPRTDPDASVQFTFCGCAVTVYSDGTLIATATESE